MNRKIVLYIATSLDGYIAGADDDLDWLFHDQDYGYSAFCDRMDAVVMGRRTWEVTRGFGPWPYGDAKGYVLSSQSPDQPDEHVEYTSESPKALVERLQDEPGKDIWLMGGGLIVRDAMRNDLVDEYVISIHPILLGDGIPLFPRAFPQTQLQLVDTHKFDSGLVQLHYERAVSGDRSSETER